MNTTYDFVHLAIKVLGGDVRGRTRLQKEVYFLAKLLGEEVDRGYSAHFYGPYSAEVAEAVNKLESLGFVDHSISSGGSRDARGFELARHDYKLTNDGAELADAKLVRLPPDYRSKLERYAAMIRSSHDLDYMQLSIAAKAIHILESAGGEMSPAEIAEAATKFGWNVEPDKIAEVTDFLKGLGLVS